MSTNFRNKLSSRIKSLWNSLKSTSLHRCNYALLLLVVVVVVLVVLVVGWWLVGGWLVVVVVVVKVLVYVSK